MLKDIGIAPDILFHQIETAAPYVMALNTGADFVEEIKTFKSRPLSYYADNLTHYFKLSLCAHWATAGSFCPTDVDNNIRYNLWRRKETTESLDEMFKLSVDSLFWSYEGVTGKVLPHPNEKYPISTHEGTWFSVAVGAYAASMKYRKPEWQKKIFETIEYEMEKEIRAMNYWLKEDLMTFVKLSALISHNLGDFDRVVEAWKLPATDPLVKKYYKLSDRPKTLFHLMCEYYKKFLSADNHRHFAYRTPKCLRKDSSLLLHIGPFHEKWGEIIGKTPILSDEEKSEIIFAMGSGFKRLPGEHFGYARAYHGFIKGFGNPKKLLQEMSTTHQKIMTDPNFLRKADMSEEAFQSRFKGPMSKMIKEYGF